MNTSKKNILVAPLNWGLGHATRCIPIIKELEQNGYNPIIASDGIALEILKKEFSHLQFLTLPSYQIEYAKNGKYFKLKLIWNSPKMIRAVLNEKKIVQKWIKQYNIDGIISDNRLGVFSKKVPSVFITHQLNVLTGNTTWITSKLHQKAIKKFKECWVPDVAETTNLTGELGHIKNTTLNLKYIGPLSRLEKKEIEKKYDLMIILSGPEPQRGILEEILKEEVKRFEEKVIFIKGKVETQQEKEIIDNVTYYNYMNSQELETIFNESELVLCRSGYTTIMDLAKLEKKAFFIPTPGQYEQEYLAKKLKRNGFAPFSKQSKFKIEKLNKIPLYQGFKAFNMTTNWKELFEIFEEK